MRVNVAERKIFYDFTHEEVEFLKSFGLWEKLRAGLQEYEMLLVEGKADNDW